MAKLRVVYIPISTYPPNPDALPQSVSHFHHSTGATLMEGSHDPFISKFNGFILFHSVALDNQPFPILTHSLLFVSWAPLSQPHTLQFPSWTFFCSPSPHTPWMISSSQWCSQYLKSIEQSHVLHLHWYFHLDVPWGAYYLNLQTCSSY